jgi:acetolactate synthase-1/2/3 large subunit
MALVRALDARPGVRPVPTLFEGVATGAADGYARIAGKPALTLLHLGPGLANGAANLHNARRAHTPVVNLVGDHATWHRAFDAPLTSDIEALAGTVSGWVRTSRKAGDLPADLHAAVDAATGGPGAVATLVVPADLQEAALGEAAPGVPAPAPPAPAPPAPAPPATVPSARIHAVAAQLREAGGNAVLFLGGDGLRADALCAAGRIAAGTGARLVREIFHARMDSGGGIPYATRLPYFPEDGLAALSGTSPVVLAGAVEPVSFFGYAGLPSRLAEESSVRVLAEPGEDVAAALAELADLVGAPHPMPVPPAGPGELPTGHLDAQAVGRVVAGHLPEGCVVSVEGSTSANAFYEAAAAGPAHTSLSLTGGAIGQGLPVALGAAIAAPDRQVIALQSDGSAQYTVQALWTMAREQTRVAIVIVSNRSYGILRTELRRMGIDEPGPASDRLTRFDAPAFDWPSIARGYGVGASRVSTGAELAAALDAALRTDGPQLIEALI